MKRLILLTVALFVTASLAVQAQSRINIADLQKKVASAESNAANTRRAEVPTTWMDLGKAYYNAATTPTAGLYEGVGERAVMLIYGEPASVSTATIGGVEYIKNNYQFMETYVKDGNVIFWLNTVPVVPNALDKSRDAYLKAASIDAKTAPAAREELLRVADAYKQDGGNYFMALRYKEAGDDFAKAYDLLENPIVNKMDTTAAFNAGIFYAISEESALGIKYLEEAVKYNYDSNGDAYFYLFHCYYALKQNDKAQETLEKGISKYPGNSQIVEAMLGFYAETGQDPESILPSVEQAIKNDPKNPSLYVGLGNIYDKIGDVDKSVDTFRQAVEVGPNDFYANFNLGLSLTKKGDEQTAVLNQTTFTSSAAYQEELAKVNENYKAALPYLEKAHGLQPNTAIVVELLKNVSFRFRDQPGMMEKYEKYNALYQAMH